MICLHRGEPIGWGLALIFAFVANLVLLSNLMVTIKNYYQKKVSDSVKVVIVVAYVGYLFLVHLAVLRWFW
jgi:hypothetical protein